MLIVSRIIHCQNQVGIQISNVLLLFVIFCTAFWHCCWQRAERDISYNAVMMYYWTLNAISDDAYYERRKEILNECGISDIHNRTLRRLKKVRGICKYWLFIVLSPSLSLSLLRLKTRIVHLMKSLWALFPSLSLFINWGLHQGIHRL